MSRHERLIAESLLFLVSIPLLFAAAKNIEAIMKAIGFPWTLDREEGFVALQGSWLAQGRSIYLPIDEYPLVVGTYAPVYPLIIALGDLLGFAPLAAGRFVTLLAALGILILIAGIAWYHTRLLGAAALAVALYASSFEFLSWGRYARVDFLAIFWGLAGIAVLIPRISTRRIVLAAVLFTIGFYTKQTQVFAAAAVGFALLLQWLPHWREGWCSEAARHLVVYTSVYAGLITLIFLFLQVITGGEFYRNAVVANKNVFEWWSLNVWLRHMWRFEPFTILGVIAALPILMWFARCGFLFRIYAVYTIFVLGSFVMIAKRGSAENYLLEIQVVLSLVPAIVLGELRRRLSAAGRSAALAGLILIGAGQAAHYYGRSGFANPPLGWIQEGQRILPQIPVEETVMLEVLVTHPPILAEEPLFAMRAGMEVLYHPFIMAQLAAEGKWDETEFLRDIHDGKFHLIIALEDFQIGVEEPEERPVVGWSPAARQSIRERYELVAVIPHAELRKTYFLYRPRP